MHSLQQHRKGGAKGQGLSTTDLAKMMQFDVKKISKKATDKLLLKAETFKVQPHISSLNANRLRILNKQIQLTFIF